MSEIKQNYFMFDGIVDEAPLFFAAFPNALFFVFNKRWTFQKQNRLNLLAHDQHGECFECEYRYFAYAKKDRLTKADADKYKIIYNNARRYINRYRPSFYVTSGCAYLYQFAVYEACEDTGISHISIFNIPANIPSYMFSLNLGDKFSYGASSPGCDLKYGNVFYSSFHYYNNTPKLKLYTKEFKKRVRQYLFEKTQDDYMTHLPTNQGIRYINKYLRRIIGIGNCIELSDVDIVIPMQVIPEASYDILCEELGDYDEAIKKIGTENPGVKFGLREHPHMYGMRKLTFWKRLPPNMRPLSPKIKKESIFELNKPVLCFNSTFFLEAAKAGSPVAFLGRSFYSQYFSKYKITIQQIKLLFHDPRKFVVDKEIFRIFENKCASAYPGLFTVCRTGFEQDVLNKDNVHKFRNNVLSFLGDLAKHNTYNL